MGRPWWYDSYRQKGKQPRRFNLPRRQFWVWVGVLGLSWLLALIGGGYPVMSTAFLLSFVYYLCRILAVAIFVRAMLSWFPASRYNFLVVLVDDISEPVLSPLRRLVPRLGMIDITPLIAITILYFIPSLFGRLLA